MRGFDDGIVQPQPTYSLSEETRIALASAQDASKRARYVLVSMTVASIVVFAAAWNSMEAGWGIRRLRIAQAALLSMDCNVEQRTVNGTPVTQPDADCVLEKARLTAFYPSPDRGQPWTYFTREEIEQGHEWLRNYRFSRSQLIRHIQNMQDSLINDVFKVRVPFLGIAIDINDLNLLGGIAFLVLLTWLSFSIAREEQNVTYLFDRARRNKELVDVYMLYAMTQVFTIPPVKKDEPKGSLFRLAKLLVALPALVQAGVVLNDFYTLAYVTGMRSVPWFILPGFVLLVIIAVATMRAYAVSRRVDRQWSAAFKDCCRIRPELFGCARPETSYPESRSSGVLGR